MRFTKMEGLGNDYIYLNCLSRRPPDPAGLAVRLSDRHFGVGADGLICVCPGRRGDFAMEMYNADGSRGKMCGNGIRCLGKYVYDKGLTRRTSLQVDTDSGLRALRLLPGPAGIGQVEVDMGEPSVFPQISIPLMELTYSVMPVSMGNPHCILFCPHPEEIALDVLGPALERHPVFPDRTNVEFVAVEGDQLRLRVWERGSGETLACGTGACAALAAAHVLGLCPPEVTALLPGGSLVLSLDTASGHIRMTGPAVTVFEGEWPGG